MISYVSINRLNKDFEVRYFSVELEKEFKVFPAPVEIVEKIEALLVELEAVPQEEARLLLLEKEVADIQVQKEELLVAKQEVETKSQKFKEYLLAKDLTEEEMLDLIDIFPSWETGVAYKASDRVKFEDRLFRVIQGHSSQADWTPTSAVSLFTEIAPPNVVPEWKQPTGAHDAYQIGDKVTFNGKTYTSLINGNTWSPVDYAQGWKDESAVEPEPIDPEPTILEWKQPTGGHDAYQKGDKVLFQGVVYESTIDSNSWSPLTYPQGWKVSK